MALDKPKEMGGGNTATNPEQVRAASAAAAARLHVWRSCNRAAPTSCLPPATARASWAQWAQWLPRSRWLH